MIKIDFHMHSSLSDGKHTLQKMFNVCKERGLQKVAITDHFRKNTEFKISDYRAIIDGMRADYPFEILVGAELEWDADEGVDYLSSNDRSLLDICLCELMGELVFSPTSARYKQERKEKDKFLETILDTYCKIAEHPNVDVIAHPFNFGRMMLDFDFDLECLPHKRLYELAELMQQNDVAYELQSQFYYWYPKMRFAELLTQQIAVAKIFKELGVRFSIGSDAHHMGTIGNHYWSEKVLAGLGNDIEIIERGNDFMHLSQRKLKYLITDSDSSEYIPARVSIFDADNNYYAPIGTFFYGCSTANKWPADWGIKGVQKYFYTYGDFELNLPSKDVTVKISHGFEYEPFEQKVKIKSDISVQEVKLKRIINMPELGWYCGDNHSHYTHGPVDYDLTEQDGLFFAASEGLNFVCFLNNKLEKPLTIESVNLEVKGHFAYEYGHHPVLNTGIRPLKALTCSLKDRGDWFSLNDWVRKKDGVIIMGHPLFANHLHSGLLAADSQAAHMTHYEIPINAISGKVDAFELQNNRLSILETWLQIWYRLLNCGINLPLSAGTDSCISVKTTLPVGVYRSYVRAKDNKFASYLAGLKAGYTFISDGPLLFLDINGKGPGEHIELSSTNNKLRIELQVKSIFPLPGMELVQNGKVIKLWKLNGECEFKATYELPIEKSCWLALRVLRLMQKTDDSEVTELFAHTNAVSIDYNATPRWSSKDALFFLQWIEVVKKYRIRKLDNEAAVFAIAEASQKYEEQLSNIDARRWIQLKQNINDQEISDFLTDDFIKIDSTVRVEKEKESSNDIECMVKSISMEAGYFYKLHAKCKRQSGISASEAKGYTYGKIIIFDERGTYLGVAEDTSAGGAWCDISGLIYLPLDSNKIQIAYCMVSTGFIEFKDVVINKLKEGLFKIVK